MMLGNEAVEGLFELGRAEELQSDPSFCESLMTCEHLDARDAAPQPAQSWWWMLQLSA